MSDPVILVSGFSATNKVPGFFATNIWASGRSTASLYQRRCLVVGVMGTSSTATANVPLQMFKPSDADVFGRRSSLACMVRAALLVEGVTLWACPLSDSGGTAATATITFTGTTAAAAGAFSYRVNGVTITGSIALGDTPTHAATAVAAAFAASADLPVTTIRTDGVVAITVDSKGVHGLQYIITQDLIGIPTGLVSTISGGSAITTNLAVPFTTGAVAPSYVATIAALTTSQWDRIALHCNEAVSLLAWKNHVTSESGSQIGHLEQFVYGFNGTYSDAVTLAQGNGGNEPLGQCLWLLNSETHPMELAASHAALRSVTEESNPSPRYMNTRVLGAAPQAWRADWAIISVRDSALNHGVTPLLTQEDGTVVVNRGITTYSWLGSSATPDFRCLDIANASMGQYARQRIAAIWNEEMAPEYTRVKAEPGANDPDPPAGTLTPSIWNNTIYAEERRWESNGWVVNVDTNKPVTIYDASGARLMSEIPVVPARGNYQCGVNVRQKSG